MNNAIVTCEQVLQGTLAAGWEKEGDLATMPLKFEYLHQKKLIRNADWQR